MHVTNIPHEPGVLNPSYHVKNNQPSVAKFNW